MTYIFIRYEQDQQHLLSKSVVDWIEVDGLEVFVSDVIDETLTAVI